MTDTGAVTGRGTGRSRWRWRGALVGGALVIGVAVGGWTWLRAHQAAQAAQARLDAAETSAWEDRQTLESLMADTAKAVGLTGETEIDPYLEPYECVRNDGRTGYAYVLPGFEAPAAKDSAVLGEVEAYWQSLGYATYEGDYLGLPAMNATTANGAQMRAVTGPGGTGLAGETGCALTDGRPGS